MTGITVLLTLNTVVNMITMCLLYGIAENVFDLHFDVRYLKTEKFIEKYDETRGVKNDRNNKQRD